MLRDYTRPTACDRKRVGYADVSPDVYADNERVSPTRRIILTAAPSTVNDTPSGPL